MQLHQTLFMDPFPNLISAGAEDRFSRLWLARSLVVNRVEEPLSVPALARHSGMSVYHFLRQFRVIFGVTPHRLSSQIRLMRARELLRNSRLSITEICFDCGYESLGSFSALFHRVEGCSPRDYRSRHQRSRAVNIPFVGPVRPFCLIDLFGGPR
jgi:transcriptional regulator GlxA family with amidase domain